MSNVLNVNLLQGTASTRDFSTGNTLPLAARPWGMHHWTFQTAPPPWMFHPDHRKLWGIRLTHQPSPWIEDYGSLLITPFTGKASREVADQASAWKIGDAVLQPHRLGAELLRYGIKMEMAPTERGAIFVFQRRLALPLRVRFSFEGRHEIDGRAGSTRLTGVSRNYRDGAPENFGLQFVAEFDVEAADFVRLENGGYVEFPASAGRVQMRLAGSFISEELAQVTLERELPPGAKIATEGEQAWNELLDRLSISPRFETQERTFYSCLYRSLLFPRRFDEVDGQGKSVHYSPYDGQVHDGPLCTDNGFWDTFRTVYPLLGLVYPDKLTGILEGWLNACREAGWSPKWASPGLRDCMIGTHFDAIVADAVSKGVTHWNVEEAFGYLWKNATVPSEDGRFGRRGLEDYVRLGFVPADRISYAVSRTLDFAYNDFCVAQVAKFLGRKEEEALLRPRTLSYQNVFDPSVGFMRARNADGGWGDFREFEWGGPYIEGGPWQHSFNVPHDPQGLAKLFGGTAALCEKVEKMLLSPPHFEVGSYGFEIHEMTEMALARFGQYAHSNQPVHNYLFFFALAGMPERTSSWVHRVGRELYSPDFFPADEDNGEMAAWYVFACLGIYPFCPGKRKYVCFEPFARKAELRAPHLDKPVKFTRKFGQYQAISHDVLIGRARGA